MDLAGFVVPCEAKCTTELPKGIVVNQKGQMQGQEMGF